MTPKQLKQSTDNNLLIAYKNKARCFHSKRKADAIYKELVARRGKEAMYSISLEVRHVEHGGSPEMFDEEIDKLITK